ncbi:MAG: hypothetical protein HZC37_28710 [Burkholderiales bacterium]|nr:hypothetical protein [Burkholderiales bacterium]
MINRSAAAWLLSSLLGASATLAGESPAAVGRALERAAVAARMPERAVLLGAAQAGARIVVVGERGLVTVSDDGGRHWAQSPTPTSVTLTAVRFADARHGYAVGHAGTVLASTDGGRTWMRRLDGARIAQIELQAAQAGGDARAVKLARRLVADGPDKPLLDLFVLDAKHLLVVGAYGMALASDDGGANWASWRTRLDNPKENHLYAVRRRGQRIVVAGEQGLLLQSTDGGASFQRIRTPYAGSWFTVELPSDASITVAGLRGNVWRSDDLGTNWAQFTSPTPSSIVASAQRPDGSLVLVNQTGMVLVSPRATVGALQPMPSAPLPPLSGVLPLTDGTVLALSVQGVHVLPSVAVAQETR